MIHRRWLILAGFALVLVGETARAQTSGGTGGTGTGTGGTGTGGTGGVTTGGGSSGGMTTFAPTQGLTPNAPTSFLPNGGTPAPGAVGAGNPGNPFNTWYASPLALGLAARTATIGGSISGTSTIPWGTALYSNVYTTTGTRTGVGTGNRGAGSVGLNRGGGFGGGLGGGTLGGFNSSSFSGGTGRTPGYVTVMQPYIRPSGGGGHVPELQQIIARSSSLPSRSTIQVHGEDVIVLRGSVSTEHERRLAEKLLRLSPGVSAIRNELVVRP